MSRVLCGDVLESLATLESDSVDCCVTSPPYWGAVRNYGHEGQWGRERTPAEFIARIVALGREVRRVLKSTGTFWLNLGDKYADDTKWGGATGGKHAARLHGGDQGGRDRVESGCKPKELVGIPWRCAFALQDDGWWLRQDCIWNKPSGMPEPVRDRFVRSHEYVFLLTTGKSYYFDVDAVAEPVSKDRPQLARALALAEDAGLTAAHLDAIRSTGITDVGKGAAHQTGAGKNSPSVIALAEEAKVALGGYFREFMTGDTRRPRSVWTIPTKPFKGAHGATFPEELPRRCILAGCPPKGVVLDPFAGSGTTLAVAAMLGREYVGIELNPEYIPLIEKRLSRATPPLALFAEAK